MNVNTLYELCKAIINKDQNGYFAPSQFNLFINQAQKSYADYLIGQYEQYSPQKSQARVSWGQNENVRESLTPIIYGYVLTTNSEGIAPYPGDYQKMDAMTTIYGFNRIRFATQDRLFSFINSAIEPIATNPIYLVKDVGFQFYPVTIGQANLSYVRNPPDIVWGYTEDGDGLPVYNSATSVDPVWSDVDCWEIAARCLRMVGTNLVAGQVSQYANEITKAGQ